MKPNLLIVDDEPAIQFGFSKYLTKAGYGVQGALSLGEARKSLLQRRFDAILLDLNLPDGNGLDMIGDLRENYPDMSIVVITGIGDIPSAVESMRRGADNFLTKPVNMTDLDVFLRKCLELGALRRRHRATERLTRKDEPYFGQSAAMQGVMKLSSLAATNDSPVLLHGETGTGKGVLARWIHDHSSRASTAFVEVNCSSLKGELLASELFGHARGAFTSAHEDRQGLIEVADGATLFLDEIGDMDPGVQAQFLKVIEERQYRRLGEVRLRRSEFRLISATNRDLMEEIRLGRFRKDLYFRIYVFPIAIPSLRERMEDVPGLVAHLLGKMGLARSDITDGAMSLLRLYDWPGNIRELRNVVERAVLLAQGGMVSTEHFPGLRAAAPPADRAEEVLNLDKVETMHVRETLKRFDGDITGTARALGISRATLYRKLKGGRERGGPL